MSKKIILILMFIVMSSKCNAQLASIEKNILAITRAHTIQCEWGKGFVSSYKGREVETEKGSFGKSPKNISMYINIDYNKNTATVIGNFGSSDVFIIKNEMGLSFIEQPILGNINITTIFPFSYNGGIGFFSVMSRHIMLDTPLPSQFYGVCRVID